MLFNSLAFALFFAAMLTLLSLLSWQRVLLLLASFALHGYRDWWSRRSITTFHTTVTRYEAN